MPRLQVYLPDDRYVQLKAADLPASELLQTAVRAETERRPALTAAAAYASELWPPLVPTIVVLDSLHGHLGRDANTNRFLKTCLLEPVVSMPVARRAAELRRRAGRGSAVDALVVAVAEPGGTIVTGDVDDLGTLAANAHDVNVIQL